MTSPSKEPAIAQSPAPAELDTANNPSNETSPSFGWNHYAERINGRFAMIGFIALLLTELVTKQDFFTWIGLR